jgi:hypothetical protein
MLFVRKDEVIIGHGVGLQSGVGLATVLWSQSGLETVRFVANSMCYNDGAITVREDMCPY